MHRRILVPFLLAWALLLAACGATGPQRQMTALEKAQYAYSAAIRWGDFEGAWQMVDPAVRAARPMHAVDFDRYKSVQVSAYHDRGAQADPQSGTAQREIQIGVIDRNTMAERQVRYSERWRYAPETKTWWITSGLPDLWAGQ